MEKDETMKTCTGPAFVAWKVACWREEARRAIARGERVPYWRAVLLDLEAKRG